MVEETVPAALAGERVDRVVAFIADRTRSAASALVADGSVRRNGAVVRKGSDRVAEGDVLTIDIGVEVERALPGPDSSVDLDVVFEDADLVVLNKAAGVVVHPGAGSPNGTLVNGLLACYPEIAGVGAPERPGIVHRLDKGTSGLLVVARSDAAHAGLIAQLGARSVERGYTAVLWGHVSSERGMVDAAIGRNKRRRTQMAVAADGKEARTRYRVVRRATEPADVSVAECTLETGRTHQIRVHMMAIGHPVVGDELYGGQREAIEFGRPALHAATLGFEHPTTAEFMRFEADLSADMAALMDRLS